MGHQHVGPPMTITFLSHRDVDRVPKSMQVHDVGNTDLLAESALRRRIKKKHLDCGRKVVGASLLNRSSKLA